MSRRERPAKERKTISTVASSTGSQGPREDWGEALRVHGGPFFGGAAWDGVGELGGWIDAQRERVRLEHRRAALRRNARRRTVAAGNGSAP